MVAKYYVIPGGENRLEILIDGSYSRMNELGIHLRPQSGNIKLDDFNPSTGFVI